MVAMTPCAECAASMSGDCGKHVAPQITFTAYVPAQPQQTGWLCPACGAGNAPWNSRCDCTGMLVRPLATTTTITGG